MSELLTSNSSQVKLTLMLVPNGALSLLLLPLERLPVSSLLPLKVSTPLFSIVRPSKVGSSPPLLAST